MAVTDPTQLKESIRQSFRKACLKRLEGRESEAIKILQEELPQQIRTWKESDDGDASDIEKLLADELIRTESSYWVVKEVESRLEALFSVTGAKQQLEIQTLQAKLESGGGGVKKSELESALWQVQNAVGDRLDAKLTIFEDVAQKNQQMQEIFVGEIKTLLADRLTRLVSAEAFEARLMAATNMLHEAQTKGLQDVVSQLQTTLDRRLNETSGPIYQRVSALMTFNDYERVAREVNEKLLSQLMAQIKQSVDEAQKSLLSAQNGTFSAINERTSTTLAKMQDMRSFVEQAQGTWQATVMTGIKTLGERMGAQLVEMSEHQKLTLKNTQREINEQQTQAFGSLSVHQQNFLGGLRRDWDLLNKNLEELKMRQTALEGDLRAFAVVVDDFRQEQGKTREGFMLAMNALTEQLKTMHENNRELKIALPAALQSLEKQLETRLRDQAQLYQAEINALHRKLETGLVDSFGKKLKNLRVVAE